MKNVLKWVGIFLGVGVLGMVIKYGILLMFAVLLFAGMENEYDSLNDASEQALTKLGLSAYVEHATARHLSIDGVITAFELHKYDYGTESYIRNEIMTFAAEADGWHIGEITAEGYQQQVATFVPDANFLFPPDDLVFDAWYQADALAFFDHDTGLLVCLDPGQSPSPSTIQADSLTVPYNGYMYELETHSGWMGEGTTYQALIVPETERSALEVTLASHADWHEGSITHAEYVTLHDREFYAIPSLYPAADVTFDWWCYVNTFAPNNPDFEHDYIPDNSDFPAVMRENGARPSGNWLVALYDADTGLFIFYQYDS